MALRRELAYSGDPADAEAGNALFDQLGQILESEVVPVSRAPRRSKGKEKQDDQVAWAEEVACAQQTYIQEFGSLRVESGAGGDWADIMVDTGRELILNSVDQGAAHMLSPDLGIAEEAQLTWTALMNNLGLAGMASLPFQNVRRHVKPYLVWTANLTQSAIAKAIRNGRAPDFLDLRLRWHQLVGISAALRWLGSEDRAGLLIGDDVGIGKTCQTLGIITLHIHSTLMRQRQRQNTTAIPLLLDHLPICSGPHIIVAPSSVIQNWKPEAMMWLDANIEIYVYEGTVSARRAIFAPGSLWCTSTQPLFQRIILVGNSVCTWL
jgi:hypothetical protein